MSRSVLHVASQYQCEHNSTGTRYVLVNNRVYKTDNPQRYIATIKRNNPGKIYEYLCECTAKGIPLQASINWRG